MELHEKDILNEYTMRKIYPTLAFEGVEFSDLMSRLGRIKKYFQKLFSGSILQFSPKEEFVMLPFCIVYPPPSGGKAVLTYKVDTTRGINAEFKIFTATIGGGLSVKMTRANTFPADNNKPQLVKMKVKRIIKEFLNKNDGQRWYEEKYLSNDSKGDFFEQGDLSTSPFLNFNTEDLVPLDEGFDSTTSSVTMPPTTELSVEEETNWKLGFTYTAVGKAVSSVLDLKFEGKKTKLFSIKYDWPVGHKYLLWYIGSYLP